MGRLYGKTFAPALNAIKAFEALYYRKPQNPSQVKGLVFPQTPFKSPPGCPCSVIRGRRSSQPIEETAGRSPRIPFFLASCLNSTKKIPCQGIWPLDTPIIGIGGLFAVTHVTRARGGAGGAGGLLFHEEQYPVLLYLDVPLLGHLLQSPADHLPRRAYHGGKLLVGGPFDADDLVLDLGVRL